MSDPIVSVLMPVFNGQKYLKEAVHSILNQSMRDLELLVIDDGSTDETSQILESFSDPRLRVLQNETNAGVAFSLNRGIRESRGRYIARMDSDDIAFHNRIEAQVQFLDRNPDVSLVGGSIQCFGESDARVNYWRKHEEIHAQCLFNTPFAHPVVCWRKADFVKYDLYYQEDPPTAEDFELWERACRHVKCANLSIPLIRYRIDPQIKLSGYLKQQFAGAEVVRERVLEFAKIALSQDEMDILHQMGEGHHSIDAAFLRKADAVYFKIIKGNQMGGVFDAKVLTRVISKHWYRLIQRFVGSIDKCELHSSLKCAAELKLGLKYRLAAFVRINRT